MNGLYEGGTEDEYLSTHTREELEEKQSCHTCPYWSWCAGCGSGNHCCMFTPDCTD